MRVSSSLILIWWCYLCPPTLHLPTPASYFLGFIVALLDTMDGLNFNKHNSLWEVVIFTPS
jgi:hypothetical protein